MGGFRVPDASDSIIFAAQQCPNVYYRSINIHFAAVWRCVTILIFYSIRIIITIYRPNKGSALLF